MDRLRLSKQLTTAIAKRTTNTTAAEVATNIYHGVLLDMDMLLGLDISATKNKIAFYYINSGEIPGELSRESMRSSHVKITCYFHM